MKKIISFIMSLFLIVSIISCKSTENDPVEITLNTPTNVLVSNTGLITWDSVEYATKYIIKINDETYESSVNSYQVTDLTKDFICTVIAAADGYKQSAQSDPVTFKSPIIDPDPPKPPVSNIKVGISGSTEVKTEKSITLKATVEGTDNKAVEWSIKNGSEYASIDNDGKLTANSVDGDKIIEVIATSVEDKTVYGSKIITIVAKPNFNNEELQNMLNELSVEKIGFEGYLNISLYKIGDFDILSNTYSTVIKTSMNGTYWYAEYENGSIGTKQTLHYKKHNNLACQVGVNFLNEEEYYPLIDEHNKETLWENAGLYNSISELKASDFSFNEETWRYEYVGLDKTILNRIIASANPYDFKPLELQLIIEDNEILGIYMKSDYDYAILQGYRAIQELFVAINYGDTVDVPTINKYPTDPNHHPEIAKAIENMRNLNNYTLTFREITSNVYSQVPVEKGFKEYITTNDCYFEPFSVSYDVYGNEIIEFIENKEYGYHKINDTLYNSYFKDNEGVYQASRAYQRDFKYAKPSFEFAAEIFRTHEEMKEDGSITYFVENLMNQVATTFYYGVGTDIELYGIFASDELYFVQGAFTPYITIKDGYIIEAGFCFYLGELYGLVQIQYSDFDTTVIPEDANIEFEVRNVPTSWSELTMIKSSNSSNTDDDEIVNALDYLKEFFGNDNIGDEMPFFGNVLGDTYALSFNMEYMSKGSNKIVNAIQLYYDVPLDHDYSIESSLEKIDQYLLSLGFEKNEYNEYIKGDIGILPFDKDLDLMIYVWKVNS